jgi:hypothetical protein
MPFYIGHYTTLFAPTSGLIAEAGIVSEHPLRGATNGSREQMAGALPKNLVLLQTDRVEETLGFQNLLYQVPILKTHRDGLSELSDPGLLKGGARIL